MANPNPSPATRFKKGNSGGGKTSEQKRLEYEAAEMAAAIRHQMLTVITEKLADNTLSDVLDILEPSALKLFKDSEDRAHGTPQASTVLMGDENAPLKIEQIERSIVKAGN